jgi:hypothetical protein
MQLTALQLARALQTILHNAAMRARAREIAAHLRYGQGVAQAIRAINMLEMPEPAVSRASFSKTQVLESLTVRLLRLWRVSSGQTQHVAWLIRGETGMLLKGSRQRRDEREVSAVS